MSRVNIYMDFDGVLNGLGLPRGGGGWDPATYQRVQINGFPIAFHGEMVNALRGIQAEFFWLTTWQGNAPRMIAPALNIGHNWPVLVGDTRRSGAQWWKPEAMERHLAKTTPDFWVWCEDDITYEMKHHPLQIASIQGRCVEPNSRIGLSTRDIEHIRGWVE